MRKIKAMISWVMAIAVVVSIASSFTVNVQAVSNEQAIFNFLTQEVGFNAAAACGVLANIEKESGFQSDLLEYGYTWESGGGYGICQWTNYPRTSPTGRRTDLVNWCTSHGYDYRSLDGQLHFLQHELNTSYFYNRVTVRMKGVTNDANGAYWGGYYWCYYFEVPGGDRNAVADSRGNLSRSKYWPRYGASISKPVPNLTTSNIESSGKIKLTWNNIGAAKYEVYRATSKNGTYTRVRTTAKTSFINTSAVAGTTYYYKVRGVFSDGITGGFSAVKFRTCDLARPVLKTAVIKSSGKIRLTWSAIEGAQSYRVYRALAESGPYTLIESTNRTSFTNSDVLGGIKYYYKVKAIANKSAANSAYSKVKARTAKLARPTASISLNTFGKPVVSWRLVEGAIAYKVYRSTSANGEYTLVKTTSLLSFTNTGASSDTTYYYKVKAVCSNSVGNSAYSKVVSIKAE